MAGTESVNAFDRLVSGLSSDERTILLDKLKSDAGSAASQTLEPPVVINEKDILPLEVELKEESLLYRFWLWLRSIFSGTTSADLYNDDKVMKIAGEVNRTYPGLIDYNHEYLLTPFYQKLQELKSAADFFRPYTERIEEDPGAFYAFLGSFIVPEISSQMDAEADPFKFPVTAEVTKDRRTSLLRKVEEILKNIDPDGRQKLYKSVSSIEWLRQFTKLPFDRFINIFTNLVEDTYVCTFSSIDTELSLFAKVLCSGKSITGEALEALFLFSNKQSDPDGVTAFLDKSEGYLTTMHIFITTVPMRSVACVVYNESHWLPESFGGAEDWFVKFREQWKKVFDERWNMWVQACRKEEQRVALKDKFGLDAFPLLPYRPWKDIWGGLLFHYELTGGFMCWFFTNRYNSVLRTLKTLMLEGLFSYNENKDQLSSELNDLGRIEVDFKLFVKRLAPNGETGLIFDKLSSEHLRTLQGQRKIDSMILAAEKELKTFQAEFCGSCRSILQVLTGIFLENPDKRYGSLKNLHNIKTADNRDFYVELSDTKVLLNNILDMMGQIEIIDGKV